MIRRFLTRILMVILIASCGYNWLQWQRLQAQVSDLNARLAARPRPSEANADWLDRANSRARFALARSDWPAAEQELSRCVAELKNVVDSAGHLPLSHRNLHHFQARAHHLGDQADALRRKAGRITRLDLK